MTCPFGSLTPPVLNYNRVSYDTSTMVHSLLIHLLKPYLTFELLTALQSFPQRSIPDREGQAPCGGLTSGPTPPCRRVIRKPADSFISTTALSIFKELIILYP